MKNRFVYLLFFLFIVFSCSDKKEPVSKAPEILPILVLPFKFIALNSMNDFKGSKENWKIVGGVYVDRSKEKAIYPTEGSGVLVNNPNREKRGDLLTRFEHGDMEFECDVMLGVGSDAGIYFQSRYEVQLHDSWGVDDPDFGDMGGIFQRWDSTKAEGEEGFEGFDPQMNAAKSPGLWQHLKVVFHAPKFDASGNKTKNAWFEKIQLNGVVIHRNIEVSGPTKGGVDTKELAQAPLLFQGNDGPVAFRNIKYKIYEDRQVELTDVRMEEYENATLLFPNLDSLIAIREVSTDSISATMATGVQPQKLLSYTGSLKIPESGDYLFDYRLNRAGGTLLIASDTVISMNGNYSLDSIRRATVSLKKGQVPFQLIYNKHVPWQIGFGLFVEGPGIQKHPLHTTGSLNVPSDIVDPNFMIKVDAQPIAQRGFWMHEGEKRTHCIAVGNPNGVHYTYDLESGSLLQAWSGDFMDATKMWRSRGEKQLGEAAGFTISLHGDSELAILKSKETSWPKEPHDSKYKQFGYEFGSDGIPIFSYRISDSKVSNKISPISSHRGLNREISISGSKEMWFKVADGSKIDPLPDGTYIINNESYFVDFKDANLDVMVRKSGKTDELLVRIPSGEQQLNYDIIW